MKYDEWRSHMVSVGDLRILGIDGFQDYNEPVPGVVFSIPVPGTFRGHPIIDSWNHTGWITFDQKAGVWDVLIENTEKQFVDIEKAARYLWDHWCKDELDPGPRYRLIGVDEFGQVLTNTICQTWSHVVRTIEAEMPDEEYNKRIIADLSRVGNRFAEHAHGHYAAFPLEDE